MSDAKYLGLTANKLARIASDLDDENAKLREQGARLFDKTLELGAENAKLRELALLVAEYVSADQCEGCVAKRACNAGELDMCWIRKAILEKLRELGAKA